MELSRIKEAADRFGTPLYLFDLDCIRDRVQRRDRTDLFNEDQSFSDS